MQCCEACDEVLANQESVLPFCEACALQLGIGPLTQDYLRGLVFDEKTHPNVPAAWPTFHPTKAAKSKSPATR